MNSIFEASTVAEFKKAIVKMLCKFVLGVCIIFCGVIFISAKNSNSYGETKKETITKKEKRSDCKIKKETIVPANPWKLIATDVESTVYNAVPKQCNKDFGFTASMFYLDLYDIEAHRIIAMERTFMKEFGLVYGDVVKIEGAGKYDGIYQIQDTMNKRFADQHKIDILVKENIKKGKWNNVKLYILKDKNETSNYTKNFKKKISKEENKKQMKQKRKEWKQNKK